MRAKVGHGFEVEVFDVRIFFRVFSAVFHFDSESVGSSEEGEQGSGFDPV
jgi:hypothetical protein